MPRIRKKTSNRTKTNDRRKVQNKVRESRKKKAKAAKNNTQWKSKHKKDPGIPSTFPYKEQILAEIAEQRREAAEEKQRRKDEKAKLRRKQTGEVEEDPAEQEEKPDSEGDDDGVLADVRARGLDQGFEGISSLSAKQLDESKHPEDDVPVLINPELPNLQVVLDGADVVLHILDARDPLAFRSEHLETLKEGKRVLFVLNKIDTIPRESASAWLTHLRAIHPTLAFRSASVCLPESPSDDKGKGKAKASATDALGADAILALLGTWAEEKPGDEPLCAAVVGVTNVGKTSLVNSLLKKAALPVYTLATSSRGPTTTEYAQEVTVEVKSKPIRLVDTPGLAWESVSEADVDGDAGNQATRARDILLRSKGRIDRLKDPILPVQHLLPRASAEDLMLLYNIPAFTAGDTDAFLGCVARANQLVKKKGELDLTGAARVVLRDWNIGRFPRYTVPPTSGAGGDATLSAADEAVLSTLPTRKEMRKARGLVKLQCGAVETRKAVLDESWVPEEGDSDESGGDDDGDEMEEDELEESSEEDEEDNEEEEKAPTPPPILSGKQKRKRAAETEAVALPRKKVSFGPEPVSKKARSGARPQAAPPSKTKPTTAPPKKVANAPVKTKASQKAAAATGPQAYNFGEFF
ncbi:hypothetical protein HMN09_00503900 [Mycena chlorophos]|uniref:CP-type G domain-containing protein n=1 Tax=Mycena chlorophos TaxID=658473 RepID=A0A8H6TCU5_MYCCL|nr:hypothetical protein HMN09_00503900 [Mycena chlorophos]